MIKRLSLVLSMVCLACPGETGLQGAQGPAGATGPRGPAGPEGPAGAKGDRGEVLIVQLDGGAAVVTGPQGPVGPKGDTGARGEKGEKGDKGEVLIILLDGGVGSGGTGITCTPLKERCEGTVLYTCTRSGKDETGFDCASYSSPAYQYGCAAPCPTRDGGACCQYNASPTQQRCIAAVTAPEVFSVIDSSTNGYCSAPSACAADAFSFGVSHTVQTCPSLQNSFSVSIDRSKVTFGSAQTLPKVGIDVSYRATNKPTCFEWSGTLTPVSDVPNWRVTMDLNCTDKDANNQAITVHLVGDFKGRAQ